MCGRPRCGQRKGRSHPETLARFALAGVVAYVGIDILLRFLRPQYSLIYSAESDDGRGPWFWVMDVNFLLHCELSLAAAGAVSQTIRSSSRVRSGLTEGQPVRGSGGVHLALALVAFISVAVGTLLISLNLRSDPVWPSVGSVLLVVSVLGAVAFVALGAALQHKHGPNGLFELVLLGLELLWVATAAGFITRRRPLTNEAVSSAR